MAIPANLAFVGFNLQQSKSRGAAMKMDKVAGSGNDEFYTPEYAITPLYKYLPPPPVTIWCPFDTEDSLFVKLFRQRGYTVIATHIANGQDFFRY
jgi:hypothetical protein